MAALEASVAAAKEARGRHPSTSDKVKKASPKKKSAKAKAKTEADEPAAKSA